MVDHFNIESFYAILDNKTKSFLSELEKSNSQIIIFGAGRRGQLIYQWLVSAGIEPAYFCDNSAKMQQLHLYGKKVLSFKTLCENCKNNPIFIAAPKYTDEIKKQLQEHEFRHIVNLQYVNDAFGPFEITGLYYLSLYKYWHKYKIVYESLCDDFSKYLYKDFISYWITGDSKYLIPLISKMAPYFEPDIITLHDHEVFVDGGAYNGDTVEDFLDSTKNCFDKVYSFEPCESSINAFMQKFGANQRIELVSKGLWNENSTLHFIPDINGDEGNLLLEMSTGLETTDVPVTSIDEVLCGKAATFIKLDIEGSELEALKGAAKTIKTFKPKLAICVYHKPLDIIDIPLYIKSLVPEYKLYLRHYNDKLSSEKDNHTGTVLYATVD